MILPGTVIRYSRPGGEIQIGVYRSVTHCSCHPERNEMESRDLRISLRFAVKLVPRSLDSLTLARDDSIAGNLQTV